MQCGKLSPYLQKKNEIYQSLGCEFFSINAVASGTPTFCSNCLVSLSDFTSKLMINSGFNFSEDESISSRRTPLISRF